MSKAYTLRAAAHGHPAGTVVYLSTKCDYGCANDDTRHTGVEHVSVTLKPDGDYPFFTVAEHYLEQAWCCEKGKTDDVAVCQDCASAGQSPQPTAAALPAQATGEAQIEAAAKKMAECFDYPWEHMPEQGRQSMRNNVRSILAAAAPQKGEA